MASLCKKGRMWYVRLRDETGRERSIKAGPDKSVANQMKRDLESKVQRIKAGVLDPREADALDAERVPIAQHVSEYIGNLEAKGASALHVENVRKRLDWFLEETKITRLSQTPSLAGGRRPEGPAGFRTVRPDGQALCRHVEVVLEVGLEGPSHPHRPAGGLGAAKGRRDVQADRLDIRPGYPAGCNHANK
jgi:hypothetical protein